MIVEAPLGTILPWVPKPEKDGAEVSVPEGWQRCDGSIIQQPSIWAGQRTPDLNNQMRFLRGAPDDSVLSLEEDQIIDHQHDVTDPGHVHDIENAVNYMGSVYEFHVGSDHDYIVMVGGKPKISSAKTGISVGRVSDSTQRGSETRPKNMHVTYIIRIF